MQATTTIPCPRCSGFITFYGREEWQRCGSCGAELKLADPPPARVTPDPIEAFDAQTAKAAKLLIRHNTEILALQNDARKLQQELRLLRQVTPPTGRVIEYSSGKNSGLVFDQKTRSLIAKIILLLGVAVSIGFTLFPHWERRWRDHYGMPHEQADTVRAFLFTGPSVPPEVYSRRDGKPHSYSSSVKWGEALLTWLSIVVPTILLAWLVYKMEREGPEQNAKPLQGRAPVAAVPPPDLTPVKTAILNDKAGSGVAPIAGEHVERLGVPGAPQPTSVALKPTHCNPQTGAMWALDPQKNEWVQVNASPRTEFTHEAGSIKDSPPKVELIGHDPSLLTPENLEYTARLHGILPEEVKRRLGEA